MTAVIGLDFGTESARALVVDVRDGRVLGTGVAMGLNCSQRRRLAGARLAA